MTGPGRGAAPGPAGGRGGLWLLIAVVGAAICCAGPALLATLGIGVAGTALGAVLGIATIAIPALVVATAALTALLRRHHPPATAGRTARPDAPADTSPLPERTPPVTVTLLYFPGCPNWQTAEANLRAALAEAGADVAVHRQVVDTLEDAERLGFLGSPTVLIDGRDPFAEPGALPGLSCRVYRTATSVAGTPTVAQLRAALAAAS